MLTIIVDVTVNIEARNVAMIAGGAWCSNKVLIASIVIDFTHFLLKDR